MDNEKRDDLLIVCTISQIVGALALIINYIYLHQIAEALKAFLSRQ
jgi:hypothetical protein